MACMQFFRKLAKKGKKEQNIKRFGQKCRKFENILKKGSLTCASIKCMKQLDMPWCVDVHVLGDC